MEGITGYVFRNAHFHIFGGVDAYFTPFLATHKTKELTTREKNDILPDHNQGVPVIPQLLSDDGEDFIRTAQILKTYGYREVNLNLGCPSRTVVAKGKGGRFPGKAGGSGTFFGSDLFRHRHGHFHKDQDRCGECRALGGAAFSVQPFSSERTHCPSPAAKGRLWGTPDRQAWEMAVRGKPSAALL